MYLVKSAGRRKISNAGARWAGQLWRRKAAERKVLKLIQVMGTLGTPMSSFGPDSPLLNHTPLDPLRAVSPTPSIGIC